MTSATAATLDDEEMEEEKLEGGEVEEGFDNRLPNVSAALNRSFEYAVFSFSLLFANNLLHLCAGVLSNPNPPTTCVTMNSCIRSNTNPRGDITSPTVGHKQYAPHPPLVGRVYLEGREKGDVMTRRIG